MEQKDSRNVRVRKPTQRKLRIVATLSQKSMRDTLERPVTAELDLLQKGGSLDAAVYEDQNRGQ